MKRVKIILRTLIRNCHLQILICYISLQNTYKSNVYLNKRQFCLFIQHTSFVIGSHNSKTCAFSALGGVIVSNSNSMRLNLLKFMAPLGCKSKLLLLIPKYNSTIRREHFHSSLNIFQYNYISPNPVYSLYTCRLIKFLNYLEYF